MNMENRIGEPNLQTKSMRLMTAFKCVKSYRTSCFSPAWLLARVGNQSRSIETRFANRESLSIIPRAKIARKTTSLNWVTARGRASSFGAFGSFDRGADVRALFPMIKAQQRQAATTTIRLTEIVVRRVRRREGAWSTQRPRLEAKRMIAMWVVIPLASSISQGPITYTISLRLTSTKPL